MGESEQGACGVFELNRVFAGCLTEQGVWRVLCQTEYLKSARAEQGAWGVFEHHVSTLFAKHPVCGVFGLLSKNDTYSADTFFKMN